MRKITSKKQRKEFYMKKLFTKLIFLILLVVVICLLLPLCKVLILEFGWEPPFPEGYTGGGVVEMPPNSGLEVYLFETYDELMSAVDKLKSRGSTFYERGIINYDEKDFDVKYVMILNAFKSDKIIKYGDDPFDRCVQDVDIINIVFFEDVTIEEFSYSFYGRYDCYRLHRFNDYDLIVNAKNNPDLVECKLDSNEYTIGYGLYINHIRFGGFTYFKDANKDKRTELTEEHFKTIIDSIEFIGFDD